MTRSKLSTKVILLAGGIGLSMAAFSGSQPAAAMAPLCRGRVDRRACWMGGSSDCPRMASLAGALAPFAESGLGANGTNGCA